jgi:hypothetical protein
MKKPLAQASGFMNEVTDLDPGTDSTVRAAWFPT